MVESISAAPEQAGNFRTSAEAASGRIVWARRLFTLFAWLFAASVAVQVFVAGLGIFVTPSWWSDHRTFVHFFEYLPVPMLIAAFVGRMPSRFKWLSLVAFLLIGVQYATIELAATQAWLAALHPVNALVIFWLALFLATRPQVRV